MDFAAGVYLSDASSPPRFCLGRSSNFLGSESGQIQTAAEYGLQQDSAPPPPPSHTLSVYTVL
jgi:hypothetical protein